MSYNHRIAFLALRIISVYLLANWLGAFSMSVVSLFSYPLNTQVILNGVVSMAVPVLFAILLWIYSDKLAGFMVKPKEKEESEMMSVTFDLDSIQILAFTIIGVFLIVNAVPSIISAITIFAVMPEPGLDHFGLRNICLMVVTPVIKIMMGLWLILGGRGLVNLIKKVRTVGVK